MKPIAIATLMYDVTLQLLILSFGDIWGLDMLFMLLARWEMLLVLVLSKMSRILKLQVRSW